MNRDQVLVLDQTTIQAPTTTTPAADLAPAPTLAVVQGQAQVATLGQNPGAIVAAIREAVTVARKRRKARRAR